MVNAPFAAGVFCTTPRLTSFAVELMPEFATCPYVPLLHPEFPVARSDPLLIPVMVNVRVGSTVARTVTDSIIPIPTVAVSLLDVVVSLASIRTLYEVAVHVSGDPVHNVDELCVGFMMRGAWVVHDDEEAAVHPMKIFTTEVGAIVIPPVKVITIVPLVPEVGFVTTAVVFEEMSTASS